MGVICPILIINFCKRVYKSFRYFQNNIKTIITHNFNPNQNLTMRVNQLDVKSVIKESSRSCYLHRYKVFSIKFIIY
jgi:hypothetical protein